MGTFSIMKRFISATLICLVTRALAATQESSHEQHDESRAEMAMSYHEFGHIGEVDDLVIVAGAPVRAPVGAPVDRLAPAGRMMNFRTNKKEAQSFLVKTGTAVSFDGKKIILNGGVSFEILSSSIERYAEKNAEEADLVTQSAALESCIGAKCGYFWKRPSCDRDVFDCKLPAAVELVN